MCAHTYTHIHIITVLSFRDFLCLWKLKALPGSFHSRLPCGFSNGLSVSCPSPYSSFVLLSHPPPNIFSSSAFPFISPQHCILFPLPWELLLCLRFLTWSLRNLCGYSDHNTPIISSQANIAYKREKYFLPVWEAGQLVAQHAQSLGDLQHCGTLAYASNGGAHEVEAGLPQLHGEFKASLATWEPVSKQTYSEGHDFPFPIPLHIREQRVPLLSRQAWTRRPSCAVHAFPDNGNSPSELGREPGCR